MNIKLTLFWIWAAMIGMCAIYEVEFMQILPMLVIAGLLAANIWAKKDVIVPAMTVSFLMFFGNLFIADGASWPDVIMWGVTVAGLYTTTKK